MTSLELPSALLPCDALRATTYPTGQPPRTFAPRPAHGCRPGPAHGRRGFGVLPVCDPDTPKGRVGSSARGRQATTSGGGSGSSRSSRCGGNGGRGIGLRQGSGRGAIPAPAADRLRSCARVFRSTSRDGYASSATGKGRPATLPDSRANGSSMSMSRSHRAPGTAVVAATFAGTSHRARTRRVGMVREHEPLTGRDLANRVPE
jgi:hypothetical protein